MPPPKFCRKRRFKLRTVFQSLSGEKGSRLPKTLLQLKRLRCLPFPDAKLRLLKLSLPLLLHFLYVFSIAELLLGLISVYLGFLKNSEIHEVISKKIRVGTRTRFKQEFSDQLNIFLFVCVVCRCLFFFFFRFSPVCLTESCSCF